MDFELQTEGSGELQIFQDVPEDMQRFVKLAPECVTVRGDFGKILFYKFGTDAVTIRYSIYDISIDTVFKARSNEKILELRIALQNQIDGTWDGIKNPVLAAKYFSLCFATHVQTRASFVAGKTYATCDFHYAYTFLIEMSKDFPVLAEFLEKAEKEKEGINISGQTFHCTPEMLAAIKFIEQNPYSFSSQKYIVENRAKEILISALEKMDVQDSGNPFILDNAAIDSLHYAKELIEKNVTDENQDIGISLDTICRKTGLNEFKLKKGFKTLFGITTIEYHMRLKMEKAKLLLLNTNEPIASIAYMLGYHHHQNFTLEFKRRFRITPKDFRREGRI